ncbi:MAG: hypothetical protein E6H08_21150, partial [Bacteroidetes bacterium]
MQSVPGLKPFFKEGPDWSFPTWQKWHAAYFSHGYLFMITLKPYEEEKILVRFAKVFEQAYTRFLDLQKAEAQAREAQIEASLERVRSRAMAMQNSDELKELIGTVFTELTKLDIVLTRCLIMIYDPGSNDSIWWMANSEAPTEPIGLRIQNHEYPPYAAYLKAWQEKKLNWVYVLEGAIKKYWDDFLFVETELSHLPDFVIAGMKAPDRVYLNASFNTFGNLTLATLEPLSNEHFDILLRFAKVFDLTYTRFNDLKQAEAQAREARIETALERVRAVAMAMRKPEDLMQISEIIYKQLQALDFANLRNVQIAIDDDEKKTYNGVEYSEFYQNRFKQVPYDSSPMFAEIAKEIKRSNNAFYQKEISGKEFEDWRIWRTNIKEREDSHIHPGLAAATSMCFYLHSVGTGMLGISTFNPIKDEQLDILKRFKNVFELSYRRYIDIEKAEAQAREAQIELALERVRARTMAMHKSVELAETSQVLFHQLSELGGIPDRISIGIADEVNSVVNFWSTDQQGSHLDHSFSARLNERTTIAKTYHAWKEQKRSLVIDLHGDELNEWIQFAREEMGIAVKDDQIKDRRVHTVAFFSHGWILVTSHGPQSTETIQILERFASVFNLTYRRFLDLEKAEAQAREAKIEAALEKVRASAMAMHNSNDISSTTTIIFVELKKLGIQSIRCGIGLLSKKSPAAQVYAATTSPDSELATLRRSINMTDHPALQQQYESWLKQENYIQELKQNELRSYYQLPFFHSSANYIPPENFEQSELGYYIPFSEGVFYAWTKKTYSDDEINILNRFKTIVDLTFRRYLDLQKAEAQARDSQIEAALERVRSRTMAMHKSDELAETAQLLYHEFGKLGINTFTCGYMFIDEEINKQSAWVVLPDGTLIPNFIQYKDWKEKKPLHILEIQGDANKEHHRFLSNHVPQFVVDEIFSKIPDRIIFHCANFSNGYLLILSTESFSPEDQQTIIRFAKVFDLTYRRFLDLQKAEAQAREAQIEGALERVRSSSLAMHKSEELKDVVKVVFENFRSLGLQNIDSVNINIFHEGSRDFDLWLAAPGQDYTTNFRLPYLDHPIANDFFKAVKKGETIHKGIYDYESKNKYFEYMFEFSDNKHLPEERKELILKGPAYSVATGIAKHSSIFIHNYNGAIFSEETNGILVRFSKVFDQAYTRFLDLQKAEAQAREAQIETVLERVRSRTMAMQKSDELTEVAGLLFEQVSALGIKTWTAGFNVWSEDNNSYVDYITSPQGGFIEPYTVYTDTAEALTDISNARKSGVEFDVQYVEGEKIKQLYLALTKLDEKQYEIMLQDGIRFPSHQYEHFVFGSKVSLMFITYEPVPEAHDIFKRLGKVFEQTYTRFLDLQKAEAQAREAQIEAALERVRSRTMAMQRSEQLAETASLLFKQIGDLGLNVWSSGFQIWNADDISTTAWMSTEGGEIQAGLRLPHTEDPFFKNIYNARQNADRFFLMESKGKELEETYRYMFNIPEWKKAFGDIEASGFPIPKYQITHCVFFPQGYLMLITHESSPEYWDIFKRFGKVFEQTYTRFLDLQKAEAQARESQIEASLERVRSKTMAMHNSEDVGDTVATMFDELVKLGIETVRCGIGIMHEPNQMEVWTARKSENEKVELIIGRLDMTIHPLLRGMYNGWRNKDITFSY